MSKGIMSWEEREEVRRPPSRWTSATCLVIRNNCKDTTMFVKLLLPKLHRTCSINAHAHAQSCSLGLGWKTSAKSVSSTAVRALDVECGVK